MVSIMFHALFVASGVCLACDSHYKMMTAQPGENVILTCLLAKGLKDKDSSMFWFRHVAGHRPEFIATLNYMGSQRISQEGFVHTRRITAKVEGQNFNLYINRTNVTDDAMYDCVKMFHHKLLKFETGILLRTADKYSTKDLIQSEDVHQHIPLTTAEHGETVTLHCTVSEEDKMLFWYKQTLGHMPHCLVAEFPNKQHSHFSQDPLRFSGKMVDGNYVLSIQKITSSDEGTYFCSTGTAYGMHFRNVTFVTVRGNHPQRSHYQTVLQQPESESVHPGDSVTLQCSVLSESCTGQHSVFWFRAGEGESHPGLLYTQGNRSEECEKGPETPSPTRSCVYSLFNNNLNRSDSGTYYCAVTTCGQILFGNGTRLDVQKRACTGDTWIVISFCSALVICLIIMGHLIYTIKRLKCECRNTEAIRSQASVGETSESQNEQRQDGVELLYSQLDLARKKDVDRKRRLDRNNKEDTIYSDVSFHVIDSL